MVTQKRRLVWLKLVYQGGTEKRTHSRATSEGELVRFVGGLHVNRRKIKELNNLNRKIKTTKSINSI